MDGARSRFNQGVVDATVDPSTFLPLPSPSDPLCLRAPWDARVWVLEVSFSDDRRLFGKTPGGLDRVLQANCHACWVVGGTPNAVKLKGFSLKLEGGVIQHEPRVWTLSSGPVEWEKEGLSMTGIPLVQLEAPTDKLRRMESDPRALRSLRPSWMLVLCMVVAYSLSCADFVFEVVALLLAWVPQTRRLLKQGAVAALSLPLRVPNAALNGTLASLLVCPMCCPAFAFAKCAATSCPEQPECPS